MHIREMGSNDVAACAEIFAESLNAARAARGLPPDRFRGSRQSIAHLLSTDPRGAFVAEDGGRPVGFAQAGRRDQLWFLGKLFVRPNKQGAGIGRSLLEHAVAYGEGSSAGIICSTADPRALRSYARLPGFELHPTLIASGTNDHGRIGCSGSVREGAAADLDFAEELDRTIRSGTHGPDLPHLIEGNGALLVIDGRGYAVTGETGPKIVAALDVHAATLLLNACLRHCEATASILIPRIGAAQQWALQVALEIGLTISPGGALATRSNRAATSAYLPDNVFC